MAADNTLVQASFKEAISGAGADVPNLKPLYDSAQAINKSVFGVINTFMTGYAKEKETQRVGKARQMSGFQKQSDDLVATMYAQDEPLPEAFMMAAASHIKDLQDEFEMYNTIGKGDTQENSMARARIMGELTRAKNKIINFRAGSQIFLEGFKDVNEGEVNGKKIAGQQQALDFKNYGGEDGLIATGKVEVNFGKNGFEITSKDYETVVSGGFGLNGFERREVVGGKMVVSLESLNKNFPQTNKEHHAGIIEDHTIMLDQGTGDGKLGERNYNEEIQLGKWVGHVNTPEKFRNMVSSSIKGVSDTSFKQHLESNLEIPISVLDNMYYDDNGERVDVGLAFKDLDRVGDGGVINEEDREGLSGQELEMFNQNVDALIDALTNVDNPAFDIGKSSKMLGQYLNQNTKTRYDYNYGIAAKASGYITDKESKGQYKFGELFNPATGSYTKDTGHKLNKQGQTLFDDTGFINDINKGIETYDLFKNKYVPQMRNGKFTGLFAVYDIDKTLISTVNKKTIIDKYGYSGNKNKLTW